MSSKVKPISCNSPFNTKKKSSAAHLRVLIIRVFQIKNILLWVSNWKHWIRPPSLSSQCCGSGSYPHQIEVGNSGVWQRSQGGSSWSHWLTIDLWRRLTLEPWTVLWHMFQICIIFFFLNQDPCHCLKMKSRSTTLSVAGKFDKI